jgi:IclR family transcriptional regulator, KDG regulon repressor
MSMTAAQATLSRGQADDAAGLNSVGKALRLVDILADARRPLTGSELARNARLPKSTTFRLLAQLDESGYVERQGPRFVVGRHVFELGNRVPDCRPTGLREIARPYLADLFVHPLTAVHLSVLDGSDVLYIDKVFGLRSVSTPSRIGGRLPATCSGVGKAMLAFSEESEVERALAPGLQQLTSCSIGDRPSLDKEFDRIRVEGVAYDRQEASAGLTCVAAPIRRWGEVVGALSLAGPVGGFVPASAAAAVRRAAVSIGRVFADECRVA